MSALSSTVQLLQFNEYFVSISPQIPIQWLSKCTELGCWYLVYEVYPYYVWYSNMKQQ